MKLLIDIVFGVIYIALFTEIFYLYFLSTKQYSATTHYGVFVDEFVTSVSCFFGFHTWTLTRKQKQKSNLTASISTFVCCKHCNKKY